MEALRAQRAAELIAERDASGPTLANAGGGAAAAATTGAQAEPPRRSVVDVLMNPVTRTLERAGADTAAPTKAMIKCAGPHHAVNLARLLKQHEAQLKEIKNDIAKPKLPYFSAIKPGADSVNVHDFIGTKAYFLDPCLARESVQCLCGGRSMGTGKCVIRKGYTFRRIVSTHWNYFLVGVKYECTALHNPEDIERERVKTLQKAEQPLTTTVAVFVWVLTTSP